MQNRECIVFERTRDTESTRRVRVCESRAHPVFNQSSSGFISIIYTRMAAAFARWNFLLPVAKKNSNAAKFNVFEAK